MIAFGYCRTFKLNEVTDFFFYLGMGFGTAMLNSYVEIQLGKYANIDRFDILISHCIEAIFKVSPVHALLNGLIKLARLSTIAEMCANMNEFTRQRVCGRGYTHQEFYSKGYPANDIYKCCEGNINIFIRILGKNLFYFPFLRTLPKSSLLSDDRRFHSFFFRSLWYLV